MPVYRIEINGHTYRVESDTELTDAQAYQAANSSPEAMKDSRERLAAANAKPLKASTEGNAVSKFGNTPIGSTVLDIAQAYDTHGRKAFQQGAQDVAEGNVKKGVHGLVTGAGVMAAPVALPLSVAEVGIPATIGGLVGGTGGSVLGKATAEGLGADEDTANLIGDVTGIAGGALGGRGANALWRSKPGRAAVLKVVKETARTGKPLEATSKEVAGHVLKMMAPEEAQAAAAPKLTARQAAAAAEQARLEAAGVVPNAEAAATSPTAAEHVGNKSLDTYRVPYTDNNADAVARARAASPAAQPAAQPATLKPAPISSAQQVEGLDPAAIGVEQPNTLLEHMSEQDLQDLVGNRSAGAMRLADRKALLQSLLNKLAKDERGVVYLTRRAPEIPSGRTTFENTPRAQELKDILGDGGLESLISMAPGSQAEQYRMQLLSSQLDPRITGLMPDATPARAISGPQGVPASAQVENPLMRALLSKVAAEE